MPGIGNLVYFFKANGKMALKEGIPYGKDLYTINPETTRVDEDSLDWSGSKAIFVERDLFIHHGQNMLWMNNYKHGQVPY